MLAALSENGSILVMTLARRSEAVMGAAVGGLVLAPYGTLSLGFRVALYVQAGVVLVVVLGLLVAAPFKTDLPARLLSLPWPLRWGLAVYGLAALLGGIVGALRGNAPEALAGQLFSMCALVLGAVAAAGFDWTTVKRGLRIGLVLALLVACVVHGAQWLLELLQGGSPAPRLYLPNAISAAGSILLGLFFALTWWRSSSRALNRVCIIASIVFAVYILGSGVRSLWLVAAPSVVIYFLLGYGSAMARRPKVVATIVLALVGLLTMVLAAERWVNLPRDGMQAPFLSIDRPEWLEAVEAGELPWADDSPPGLDSALVWQADEERDQIELGRTQAIEVGHAYRARAWISGTERSIERVSRGSAVVDFCYLSLDWLSELQWLDQVHSEYVVPGVARQAVTVVGVAPAGARAARLRLACSQQGSAFRAVWGFDLVPLEGGRAALVFRQLSFWGHRGRLVLGALLRPRSVSPDVSIRTRQEESRQLMNCLSRASGIELLIGHGLGALWPCPEEAAAELSEPAFEDRTNYIHNYYQFLAFKLGILGGSAVVLALAFWMLYAVGRLRAAIDQESRLWFSAVVAAWLAYAVWSLASPQFLSFRMAPLWGLLIVASAHPSPKIQVSKRIDP